MIDYFRIIMSMNLERTNQLTGKSDNVNKWLIKDNEFYLQLATGAFGLWYWILE